jgi:MFS transporter, MHS family, proline/betaine transporter
MSHAPKIDVARLGGAARHAATRRRAILSSAIGNFFELFDFTIYGYFAVAI